LLALAFALIVQGVRAYRDRARRPPRGPRTLDELCARALEERARKPAADVPVPVPPAARTSEPEARELPEVAPLPERLLAFLIDMGIVLVGCALVVGAVPGLAERATADPRAQLALGA